MERSEHAAGDPGEPVLRVLPIPVSAEPPPGPERPDPEPPSIALVAPAELAEEVLPAAGAGGMRRLLEAMVLFFSAILFLRAMAVEPFGVPTGSMAPTLTGNHRCAICPRCGYLVRVGEPLQSQRGVARPPCPNCGGTGLAFDQLPEIAGDRLLVDKNVFGLRRPRRWEVAVFRCPVDNSKPYVKRVAGLPGERLQVHDGDLYVNGELARKTLADCRQTGVPVFEMAYVPEPGGWKDRWEVETPTEPAGLAHVAAVAGVAVDGGVLRFEGTGDPNSPRQAVYKHVSLDTKEERPVLDWFAYNGVPPGPAHAVHDFMVEFDLELLAGAGAVSCQLTDGRDEMTAYFGVGETADQTRLVQEKSGVVRTSARRLEPGKTYKVEMAFEDRRVSVAVNGREPFNAFDLPAAGQRLDVSRPLRIGVQGVSAVVRRLRLSRDIYYRVNGRNAVLEPHTLGPDEYFMLGDNSANSDDSRAWEIPGVPERNFLGKPFLLHQPSRQTRLELAGRVSEFQSIDWDRIRWLR